MKVTLKRVLGYTSVLLLVLLTGLLIWVFTHQDKLKQTAIDEINARISARIGVGEIRLDWFSEFPFVSIDLTNIHVGEPDAPKKTLLHAAHLYLSFNLYDILMQRYRISRLRIDSGIINIHTDRNGKPNYQIFKSDSGASAPVTLEKIALSSMQYNYIDQQQQISFSGYSGLTELFVDLSPHEGKLMLSTEVFSYGFRTGKTTLLRDKPITLRLNLLMDADRKLLTIVNARMQTGQLRTTLDGSIDYHQTLAFTINCKTGQTSFAELASLLPGSIDESLRTYQSEGDIRLNMTFIKNKRSAHKVIVRSDFQISKGSLKEPTTGTTIDHIECRGKFSNEGQIPILELRELGLQLQHGSAKGQLTFGFSPDPVLVIDMEAKLPLQELVSFAQLKQIQSVKGEMELQIKAKGHVSELKRVNNLAQGNIRVHAADIHFIGQSANISALDLQLQLKGDQMLIEACHLISPHSDVHINGSLDGLIGYFTNKAILKANLNYRSDHLSPEHILFPAASANSDSFHFSLPHRMQLNMDLAIGELNYRLFHATRLKGHLDMQENACTVKQLQAETMGGRIVLDGIVRQNATGHLLINNECRLEDINLNELFKQCGEFGQQEITSQHISGTVNGHVELLSEWTPDLHCVTNALAANSDLTIRDGSITNYKPLESLSSYADIADLRNLKFSVLSNRISVRNRTLFIPEMDVVNNALNVTLSGQHTFDNIIDYRLKIRLKELLAGKRKKQTSEYEEEDESGKGLYLYLTMKGLASDPVISYDKVAVKSKMKQDLKKEQESIKSLFQKEFGTRDTLIREKHNNTDELEFEKD